MDESRLQRSRKAVDRFVVACNADQRVLAAFLGGSFAAGTADDQSDIDVYLITGRGDYDAFFASRESFLLSWDRVAWWKDRRNFEGLGFDMILFMMKDGVDGELALAHECNFRMTHGGPHVVLLDRVGLLEGVKFPLLEFEDVMKREEIETGLTDFWLETRGAVKGWSRGRLWEAAESLGRMRKRCLNFARVIHADDQDERLALTFTGLGRNEIAKGIKAAVETYTIWAPEAAKKVGATYPAQLARLYTQRVRLALDEKNDSSRQSKTSR